MGNCASQADKDEKARSDLIDKQLEDDSKKFKKECKILLLGASFTNRVGTTAHRRRHIQALASRASRPSSSR